MSNELTKTQSDHSSYHLQQDTAGVDSDDDFM